MVRRTWWTARRKLCAALLIAALAWVSGTHEIYVGQPLDEAKAVLWRAGATDLSDSCGMHPQLDPGQKSGNRTRTHHAFANGRTIYIVADRDDESQPYRVAYFHQYIGSYKPTKGKAVQLPLADSVTLRRSVLAFVPNWGW